MLGYYHPPRLDFHSVFVVSYRAWFSWSGLCFLASFAVILLQSLTIFRRACQKAAQARRRSSAAMFWIACSLFINAVLVFVGPILSFVAASSFGRCIDGGQCCVVNFNICFQVSSALFVSGMSGEGWLDSKDDLQEFKMLAEMSGLASTKRIVFPGKINHDARDCIVSFPGKYPELWNQAAQAMEKTEFSFSLACYFLTDRASGLGEHVGVPHLKGGCWCHTIYGKMLPSAYLSVVDLNELKPGDNEQELLRFKLEDAETMGQHLIIKRNQSELEWQQEVSQALVHAEELCKENRFRAPWGCLWFEVWRRKVEEAVIFRQTLHVVYFRCQCGKGKMKWQDLCNERARDLARKDTGLGMSQTAEVAYLDHRGIPYQEHDVTDFYETVQMQHFDFGLGLASSTKRIAFHGKVNPGARDCIASFPGKYNNLWHKAVQATEDEAPAFSLACVFLTDKASGLGQHASVPHLKGGCWCHTIYGHLPGAVYLSVVAPELFDGKEKEDVRELLAFKRADAEAMGQEFIIKAKVATEVWQQMYAEAKAKAEDRCRKNNGRAPWGCQWFEAWRLRVEQAVEFKQTLHVFYFEDKVGQGKMNWEDLCNEKARAEREDTGLGESQTAEVAYLTLNKIPFEEHNVTDFEDVMFGKSASFHAAVVPETGDDSTAAL